MSLEDASAAFGRISLGIGAGAETGGGSGGRLNALTADARFGSNAHEADEEKQRKPNGHEEGDVNNEMAGGGACNDGGSGADGQSKEDYYKSGHGILEQSIQTIKVRGNAGK